MENFKHTPGPWKINSEYPAIQIWTGKQPVCTTWGSDEIECFPDRSEGIANAHLIAEAPDLLEALCNAIKFIKCSPHLAHEEMRPKGLESWETIIAKATNQKEVENESI